MEKTVDLFARGILISIKIVLLDEALSSIDLKTDEALQGIFQNEFKGTTLILIAHRILTAADSDRILVMDSGECVEFESTISFVEKKDSYFNKLANSAGPNRAHFECKNRYNTELDQK